MRYLFGGLVLINAITLGYYLFIPQPSVTDSLKLVEAEIIQPLAFTNSATYIAPPIGKVE